MTADIGPKDHGEVVATFRYGIIGRLVAQSLEHGALAAAFRELAQERYRFPGSTVSRTYAASTIERWYYAYRAAGTLDALRPRARSDQGRGRELNPELREFLCDIRREHPEASVPLILRTLVSVGLLRRGEVKANTVRRLFASRGLKRTASTAEKAGHTRLRWQAAAPDALWHGDVCHGPTLTLDGKKTRIRVHGLLDDCSRYPIALEAREHEEENDMLAVLIPAIRTHGKPDALYLDNGSTYRGEILATACSRLGIALIHAKPYDPQARGKMERFWRTLRENCLSCLGSVSSLDEVNARLRIFLDRHYKNEPHAGLLGQTPVQAYAPSTREGNRVEDDALRAALSVQERRRLGKDTTLRIEGKLYELEHGYLAGRVVTVGYSLLDTPLKPWVEEDGRRLALHPVDAQANGARRRPSRYEAPPAPIEPTGFDPTMICAPEPSSTLRLASSESSADPTENDDEIF